MLTLTGCSSVRPSPPAYGHSSQPGYLYLWKGVPIPTQTGTYTPPADETWVHPQVLVEKDARILELSRALEEVSTRNSLRATQ